MSAIFSQPNVLRLISPDHLHWIMSYRLVMHSCIFIISSCQQYGIDSIGWKYLGKEHRYLWLCNIHKKNYDIRYKKHSGWYVIQFISFVVLNLVVLYMVCRWQKHHINCGQHPDLLNEKLPHFNIHLWGICSENRIPVWICLKVCIRYIRFKKIWSVNGLFTFFM